MSKQRGQRRFDTSQLRITRGALTLLFLQVGMSLIWLLSDESVREDLGSALIATSDSVWREGKVWTLLTSSVLETSFPGLLLGALVLWWFVPTLERWWGIKRFLWFAVLTSLAGNVAGTLAGIAIDRAKPAEMIGYDPFIFASIVAFGILYAKQPVQFFGVLPMTGRQLMIGIIAFASLFVLLGQQWELGAGYVASMTLGGLLATGKWNPRLWWYKWRHKRARSKLEVLDGGRARGRRTGSDDKYVN